MRKFTKPIYAATGVFLAQLALGNGLLDRNHAAWKKIHPFAAIYSEKVTMAGETPAARPPLTSPGDVWGMSNSKRNLVYAICDSGYYAKAIKPEDNEGFRDDSVILVKNDVSYESAANGSQGMMRERMAAYGQGHPLLFPFAPRIGQKLSDVFPSESDKVVANSIQHKGDEYSNVGRFVDKDGIPLLEELVETAPEYKTVTSVKEWMQAEGDWHPRRVVEQLYRRNGALLREVEYSYVKTVPFKESFRTWTGWKENALVITDHGEYLYQDGALVPDPRYADSQRGKLMRRIGMGMAIFLVAAIPFGLVLRSQRRANQLQKATT